MKKYFFGSSKVLLIFLIISFFIGFFVTLQWKSEVPSSSLYPLDQLEAQKELLQVYVEEQQTLEKETSDLRNELSLIQKNLPEAKKTEASREEQKENIGLTEITDDGVEIFLADSPLVSRDQPDVQEEGFIHASDLRDVFNLLFASEAEAISVNGRRILPLYAVNIVGNTFLINDFYTFPPFTITAIGPPDELIARLDDENFLSHLHRRSREKKLHFSYQFRENITSPAYKGPLRTNFLSLYKEP